MNMRNTEPLLKRLHNIVPKNLIGIPNESLLDAFQILREGHSLDHVIDNPSRRRIEALLVIQESLQKLAHEFQDGSIGIFRTIEVNDPNIWVQQLSKSISLGIYWTYTKHYVQSHEDHQRVLFYARASISTINWIDTIVLNANGVEDEIRLIQGKEIKLMYTEPEAKVNSKQFA